MKMQFRLLDVPTALPISGVTASLRKISDGSVITSDISDTDGVVSFQTNGTPPPCQVQITKGSETRFVSSQVTGPAGAFDISEFPVTLQALKGVSADYGDALMVVPTNSANRTVQVQSGLAVTPDGFVFVAYEPTTLSFSAPTTSNRIDLIVVDGSTAAATYGQTQLKVVQGTEGGSAPATASNQTLVATVTVRPTTAVIGSGDISVADQQLMLQGIRSSQRPVLARVATTDLTTVASTTAQNVSGLQAALALPSGTWDVAATFIGSTNGEVETALWTGSSTGTVGSYFASGTGRSQTGAVLKQEGVTGGQTVAWGVNVKQRSGGTPGDYSLTSTGTLSFNSPYAMGTSCRIAKGPTYLYVANPNYDNILIVNPTTGGVVGKYGTSGTGNGEFSSPIGVAVYGTSLYVCDMGNDRIQRLAISGSTLTYVSKWGSNGTGNSQFRNPVNIAVNGTYIYTVDNQLDRVQRFLTSDQSYVSQWGSTGSASGLFDSPQGVALDSSGNVYVADSGNLRIQKFSSAGTWLATYNLTATPLAIEVDTAGNMWTGYPDAVEIRSSSNAYRAFWLSGSNGYIWGMALINSTGTTWATASGSGLTGSGTIRKLQFSGEFELLDGQLVVEAIPRR